MKSASLLSLVSFLLLGSLTGTSSGSWKNIAQFPGERAECGYFWDEMNGIVGFGEMTIAPTSTRAIRWTADGGATWKNSITPAGKGAVTSIYMVDRVVGYASVYTTAAMASGAIWKTTDGGKTWSDHSFGDDENTPCVYATPAALIRTNWFGSQGGFSTNDGQSYTPVFTFFSGDNSNGIDFADGSLGVVTTGPNGGANSVWYTGDGGLIWNRGSQIPEAWGVYAVKGTRTFIALPEGKAMTYNSNVYASFDAGATWNTIFTFQNLNRFTGHIAGGATSVYVQSDLGSFFNTGMYRSDNLGQTWKNVRGPSNNRDTRFVVTGCVGQTVYAFDDQGNIWKTTDGGDGTLTAPPGGSSLSFAQDSLYEETRYCQPITWNISLFNPGCTALTIDGVTVVPDPAKEFTIGAPVGGTGLAASGSTAFPITFRSDSNVTRHALIHIKAHSGPRTIDTTIILVAKHSTAPEPYLLDIKATKVGDTVTVPVYLKMTKDTFAITHFSFHLSYDGDILTPAYETYRVLNTLSDKGTVNIGPSEPNGILVTVDVPRPITQDSDLTKPLINLRMGVTLSKNMSCPVRLDSFAITPSKPLSLCTIPLSIFSVDPECGDSTISAFMYNGVVPGFLRIRPNPSSGYQVEAAITVSERASGQIDIIDSYGTSVRSKVFTGILEKGTTGVQLSTQGLASGIYTVRLHLGDGSYSSARLVIIR